MRTAFIFVFALGAALMLAGIPSVSAAADTVVTPSIVSPYSANIVPVWSGHHRHWGGWGGYYGGYYPGYSGYYSYPNYGGYSYSPSTTCVWNGYQYTCYNFSG
jgi:hypothetical protein